MFLPIVRYKVILPTLVQYRYKFGIWELISPIQMTRKMDLYMFDFTGTWNSTADNSTQKMDPHIDWTLRHFKCCIRVPARGASDVTFDEIREDIDRLAKKYGHSVDSEIQEVMGSFEIESYFMKY